MRLLVLLSLVLPLAAQQEGEQTEKKPNPAIGNPQAIEAGRKLFANSCAYCHGGDGRGGRGPHPLPRVGWRHPGDDGPFKTIPKSIPGGGKPPTQQPGAQPLPIVPDVPSPAAPAP